MKTSLNHLHKDLALVKADIALIKHILMEEGEMTAWAKKQLKEARKTPESRYIQIES